MLESPTPGRTFRGENLLQIAMPMGGIGAGCVCLNGDGGVQDFSVRHKPATTASKAWPKTPGAFAVLRVDGARPITRLVEGPLSLGKIYDQGIQAEGYLERGCEGLPRLADCAFTSAYPFGVVSLSDPDIPLTIRLTGWSPFIPLDDRNSGIPCAILEYELSNPSAAEMDFEFSYHLRHPASNAKWMNTRNAVIPGAGVSLTNVEDPHSEAFGSASLSVVGHTPAIKAMWTRAPGFDISLISLWNELSAGAFRENIGNPDRAIEGATGGSILLRGRVGPSQSVTYPIVITWYFPNSNLSQGEPAKPECCPPGTTCLTVEGESPAPRWRPYYAGQWKDAADVSAYVREHFQSLRSRTLAFQRALSASTVPADVIDAVSSNLAILKSPTILRQENGNLWAWEGCFAGDGCCPGSCTHVWNYAQALPHLFPALERTFREGEWLRSMDEAGHVQFRSALPDGPSKHDYHPAADGQFGGVMKLYRDWQISGDRAWLARLYPLARRSLEYGINRWDPDHQGAVIEPHHNTYDIEFWGPDSLCTSIYLGALLAAAAMAEELGHSDDATRYRALADKGKRYADAELFNGEYYAQKVMWDAMRDDSFREELAKPDADPEYVKLLREGGPRHQIGAGCLTDAVLGAWMARIYGIGEVLNSEKVRSTLEAIFKHNYKPSLWNHASVQRAGYAIGREAGVILCTWPRGSRLALPMPYCDEVWTGIEYQLASHLIEEGMTDEGLTIVASIRARHDGRVRNPFNEYECGNYYARALASYAVLNSLAGFRYSAVTRTLWLASKIETRPWQTFFAAATGFGIIRLDDSAITIELLEGKLAIDRVILAGNNSGPPAHFLEPATATPAHPARIALASCEAIQSQSTSVIVRSFHG